MSGRHWCFTLNNYKAEEVMAMEDWPFRYLIYGYEVGEEGTPHIQGYIELRKVCRLAAMKKLNKRAHWEPRKGPREAARDYCKKGGEWLEFGNWEAGGQGKRTDLQKVMSLVKEGKERLEIMEEAPAIYARNMRFVEAYRAEIDKAETRTFRNVDVEVLWGDAGVGKSRKAHEYDPKVFTVNCDESFPFDGYSGEKTILLDDFYGDIKYSNLLRILDGYQYRCNVKGGHAYAKWTKVFITSNKKPSEWYKYGLTPALQRRLTTVTELRNEEPEGNTELPVQPTISDEDMDLLFNYIGLDV